MGTSSASIPQNQRWRSGIAVGHVTEGSWVRFPLISGWIFQKVLPEMVQKGLILSQKGLISKRRNFDLFAPKSIRFPSKERKSKDLSF